MSDILTPEEQHQAGLTRKLVRAVGGVEAASEVTGKCIAHISRCTSPNNKASISLRDVAELEAVTHGTLGHPIVTRHLAARNGYALVALPTAPATGTDLLALLSLQAREFGELSSGAMAALADQKVDGAENSALRKQISIMITELVKMDAELELLSDDET